MKYFQESSLSCESLVMIIEEMSQTLHSFYEENYVKILKNKMFMSHLLQETVLLVTGF